MAARRTTTTRITARVEHNRGVFMISVAAELAEMHPQTLRMYETRGLIEPQRSPKGTRLYSQADVERLRRIQEMTTEWGMNLAGVERVFELEEQLDRMQRKVSILEKRAELLGRIGLPVGATLTEVGGVEPDEFLGDAGSLFECFGLRHPTTLSACYSRTSVVLRRNY